MSPEWVVGTVSQRHRNYFYLLVLLFATGCLVIYRKTEQKLSELVKKKNTERHSRGTFKKKVHSLISGMLLACLTKSITPFRWAGQWDQAPACCGYEGSNVTFRPAKANPNSSHKHGLKPNSLTEEHYWWSDDEHTWAPNLSMSLLEFV